MWRRFASVKPGLVLVILCGLLGSSVWAALGTVVLAAGPPVAVDQIASTRESTPLDLVLEASDPDSDLLTFAVVATPTHGDIGGPDCVDFGVCVYTPAPGYVGPDSFTFIANDGGADSNVAIVSITVRANSAPVAEDLPVSADSGQPVAISLPAADADLDPLTFSVDTGPDHGTLAGAGCPADGFCYYTSEIGYAGPDSFTFRANDGLADSNAATVTITVATEPSTIVSSGPLTRIETTPDLNCAVNHASDLRGEFYGDTACATLVGIDGVLYGPASIPAGPGVDTAFTAVSQSAVTGTGSDVDPLRIVTVVDLGATGLRLTQTDSYVIGQEAYRTDIAVTNAGSSARTILLYRAGDCFLQNSDQGFGSVDSSTGAVACVTSLDSGARIEQWFPLSAGSHYYEAGFFEVWSRVAALTPFPDTCECNALIDNGAGLSWEITVPAGGTVTRSQFTGFSPIGRVPLSTTKAADAGTTPAGGSNGYTITFANPNEFSVSLSSAFDDLPAGFSYVVGSTSGAVSADPVISDSRLTWSGPIAVAASGTASIHFAVTVADSVGTYRNEAGGTAGSDVVVASGPTAPVAVTTGTPAPTPTPTPLPGPAPTPPPGATPTPTPTPLPGATPTPTPTPLPGPAPTPTPGGGAAASPTPTPRPSPTPTPRPSPTPTPRPSPALAVPQPTDPGVAAGNAGGAAGASPIAEGGSRTGGSAGSSTGGGGTSTSGGTGAGEGSGAAGDAGAAGSPAPSPTGGVLGAVGEGVPDASPAAGTPSGIGGDVGRTSGLVVQTTAMRSSLVASVTDLDHVTGSLDVIGTNLLLAMIMLLAIGLTSALFNATLDENRSEIEGWFARVSTRTSAVAAPLLRILPTPLSESRIGRVGALGRLAAVLVLTALIYGFLSPDFGLDARSLVVFVSMLVGLGVVTYLAEGGSVLVSNRRLHVAAGLRIYGAALAIAIGSVVVSRMIDFKPGVLYGFVASAVLLAPITLGRRQQAEIVLVPTLLLLAASLAAWLLLVPLRAASQSEESWMLGLLEAVAAIVFVAGLESVFFNMIPIDFMDGATIARWNRAVWAVTFGFSGFLFWHLLLNQNKSYLAAFAETKVIAAFTVVALFSIATVAIWTYFHLGKRRSAPAG